MFNCMAQRFILNYLLKFIYFLIHAAEVVPNEFETDLNYTPFSIKNISVQASPKNSKVNSGKDKTDKRNGSKDKTSKHESKSEHFSTLNSSPLANQADTMDANMERKWRKEHFHNDFPPCKFFVEIKNLFLELKVLKKCYA